MIVIMNILCYVYLGKLIDNVEHVTKILNKSLKKWKKFWTQKIIKFFYYPQLFFHKKWLITSISSYFFSFYSTGNVTNSFRRSFLYRLIFWKVLKVTLVRHRRNKRYSNTATLNNSSPSRIRCYFSRSLYVPFWGYPFSPEVTTPLRMCFWPKKNRIIIGRI